MNQISPDARLAVGLVVLVLAVTFISAMNRDTGEQPPAYASNSSQPDGTLALSRWLDKVGYDVSNRVGFEFEPPDNAALIATAAATVPARTTLQFVTGDMVAISSSCCYRGAGRTRSSHGLSASTHRAAASGR